MLFEAFKGRREDWLVSREGVNGVADAFETPSMALEHSESARVDPRCDLRNILCAVLAELAENSSQAPRSKVR